MGDVKDKPRVRIDLNSIFVPVIFANGEDDDTPGLVAAIKGEAVMLDERVLQPPEDVILHNRTLVLTSGLYICGHDCDGNHVLPPNHMLVREGPGPRKIEIIGCQIELRW